jgi:hypothetical protein
MRMPRTDPKTVEEENRLQPDPMLKKSVRPTVGQIALATLLSVTAVASVFYAVTRESTEAERTAKTLGRPPISAVPPSTRQTGND